MTADHRDRPHVSEAAAQPAHGSAAVIRPVCSRKAAAFIPAGADSWTVGQVGRRMSSAPLLRLRQPFSLIKANILHLHHYSEQQKNVWIIPASILVNLMEAEPADHSAAQNSRPRSIRSEVNVGQDWKEEQVLWPDIPP